MRDGALRRAGIACALLVCVLAQGVAARSQELPVPPFEETRVGGPAKATSRLASVPRPARDRARSRFRRPLPPLQASGAGHGYPRRAKGKTEETSLPQTGGLQVSADESPA